MKLKMNTDASNIYRKICKMISKNIRFDESREILRCFYPTNNVKEIKKRQKYLKGMIEKVGNLKIGKIAPINFNFKRLNDRLLVVSEDEYDKAAKLNLCDVETEPIEGYPLLLSTQEFGIVIGEISIFDVAPDLIVETLYRNKEVLLEINRIFNELSNKSVTAKILDELKKIEEIYKKQELIESVDELVYSKLKEVERSIEEKLSKEKVVLSGKEIIEYLTNKKSSKLSKFEEYAIEEIIKAEKKLCKMFGVYAEIFSKEAVPRVNNKELERLKFELEKELVVERFLKSKEIVDAIKNLLPKLEEELKVIYELEFVRALKEFFNHNFTFPEFDGKISFESAYNLFIQNPQPISYFIDNKNVIVLTGANSGGKTSLLELIAQVQILAQMGLPVPAKRACVDVLDEIFLFKRKKTAYDAGTFESTLKSFTSALTNRNKKLVLIDEFEAITEPGAAVKIVSEFLKIGYEKGFYMVVVSHMGSELKERLSFIRVDGIEAKGLDENLNLIVDRQPKIGVMGKSTPELVVERLFKLSKGEKREILERILKVFN